MFSGGNTMELGRASNIGPAAADSAVSSPHAISAEQAAEQRELIKAVKAVNAAELFGQNSELTFVFDRQTQRALVRVVDKQTHRLVMQIPPEYVIRLAEESTSE
jgi:uncharacterized FlaG/YvyC family protein